MLLPAAPEPTMTMRCADSPEDGVIPRAVAATVAYPRREAKAAKCILYVCVIGKNAVMEAVRLAICCAHKPVGSCDEKYLEFGSAV